PNAQRTAMLFEHQRDLYYATFDGTHVVRLTRQPANREFLTFSPNGELAAYVRDHNLYVVDVATQTERALTTDGSDVISNGKPDWVYGEEVFSYQKTFWWSPDSLHLAYLRFDDRPVPRFTVLDQVAARQVVENTPYPKAGEPNPLVKLGILSVQDGKTAWVGYGSYPEKSCLLSRAAWFP